MVVGVAFVATYGSVVFFNPVLGVFARYFEEDFGWSRGQVAWAITFGTGAAAVAAPGIGWVIDRWGGRWVITIASLAMGACLIGLSRIDALWQLYLLYAIGRALSVGALSSAAFVAAANWFVRRRALAISVVAVGPRLGMATFPVLAAFVIAATGDWRAGWIALAAIILAAGVLPPALLMRRRPEDIGLRPDGDAEPVDIEGLPSTMPNHDFTLRQAARTRAYWFVGVAVALIMFCGGAVNFHQIPHLVDQGLSTTEAALIVTVFSVLGAAGALLAGAVATRITMRWTLVVTLGGLSASILLLLVATSVIAAMVYAVTYGLFFGAVVALDQGVYADYFGRASLGVIRGSFQPAQMAVNALSPALAGIWYDQVGSYTLPFLLFSALFALAALLMALAPYPSVPSRAPAA